MMPFGQGKEYIRISLFKLKVEIILLKNDKDNNG